LFGVALGVTSRWTDEAVAKLRSIVRGTLRKGPKGRQRIRPGREAGK